MSTAEWKTRKLSSNTALLVQKETCGACQVKCETGPRYGGQGPAGRASRLESSERSYLGDLSWTTPKREASPTRPNLKRAYRGPTWLPSQGYILETVPIVPTVGRTYFSRPAGWAEEPPIARVQLSDQPVVTTVP